MGTELDFLETAPIATINKGIEHLLQGDEQVKQRERAAIRIQRTMRGIACKLLKLQGRVTMFGSFLNGFKTGGSDLDIVFLGDVGRKNLIQNMVGFAKAVPDFGFEHVTRIFSANVPLLKFSDKMSGMEVDFCIDNELGVRNSELLSKYSECDERVIKLGRVVKDWAKSHELVGTVDGCLNSYAYMLLVIHFLQGLDEPVVPNLQEAATEPVWVVDTKWGGKDRWDTKFCENLSELDPTTNSMTVGELLVRLFHYYACVFDWQRHAVCMRLNRPGHNIDKYTLSTPTTDEQWYVEDPFDLKHNLGGKCTRAGRQRIIDGMREALRILTTSGDWFQVCPPSKSDAYFLKCRISSGVTPHALLEEFDAYNLVKLHFSKPEGAGRMGQAFLEFDSALSRRKAHTKNESYVEDCQLQLHYSSQHSLSEAVDQGVGVFTSFDVASYRMQRQALKARHVGLEEQAQGSPRSSKESSAMGQGPEQQQQQQQQLLLQHIEMVPPMMPGMLPMYPYGYIARPGLAASMYPSRRGQRSHTQPQSLQHAFHQAQQHLFQVYGDAAQRPPQGHQHVQSSAIPSDIESVGGKSRPIATQGSVGVSAGSGGKEEGRAGSDGKGPPRDAAAPALRGASSEGGAAGGPEATVTQGGIAAAGAAGPSCESAGDCPSARTRGLAPAGHEARLPMNAGAKEAVGLSNGRSAWLTVPLRPGTNGSFLTVEQKLQLQRLVAAHRHGLDEPRAAQHAREHVRIRADLQLQTARSWLEPMHLRTIAF